MAILAIPLLAPPRAAAGPVDGTAMWVWYVAQSGGSAERIAERARRHDIDAVFVKSGDAGSYWSQFDDRLVSVLHDAGIDVCAWQFVYGDRPVAEARIGALAEKAGADCLIIDAETAYEGEYAAADRYVRTLRRRVGKRFPLALSSFPYVDYHPAEPYSVFLGPRGARFNLPQVYWHTIGTSVRTAFAHTYAWNRPYGAPIHPVGQTYDGPPRDEVVEFRRYAEAYGADGVSWWSWQETEGREWRWVSRRLKPGAAVRAKPAWVTLEQGDRGDPVVWAQQLLRAAGEPVKISGRFGRRTTAAVRRFQLGEAMTPSGEIDKPTWRALLENPPAGVTWTPRRSRRVARAATAPSRPSVRLYSSELPATPGRP